MNPISKSSYSTGAHSIAQHAYTRSVYSTKKNLA